MTVTSRFIADFHLHSRYSRACSKDLTVAELAKWAKIKGIGVLGTGDFTHPLWLDELKDALRDAGGGLYEHAGVRFLLTAEVNTLFYRDGRAHQIHHILFLPSLEAAERLNKELASFGGLDIDGRPTLRIEPARLVDILLGLEPRGMLVPAHAWTPWFAIFGSTSGFDAVEACFERQSQHIYALETGLSSDPAMNWRLTSLDRYTLISNSDAHSARRIGREANIFEGEANYDAIVDALKRKGATRLVETIEFFPEEGKYHYDGHRICNVRWSPAESKQHGLRCSVCGRKITVGVMHRVQTLADRPEGVVPPQAVPFRRTVPLEEIIAEAFDVGAGTQTVDREYQALIYKFGSEFGVLLEAPAEELRRAAPAKVAEGILRMREGRVTIEPGYDGEYGKVRVFDEGGEPSAAAEQQMTLF
ncbi:MAG: DNA helicase UvrD [Omnitrophica WOR_2 bacterium RIFCSPHIGHO2_02_FULL_67_20]|nr:MAG: DNA helicase UvrD [Omnitrophica WOR_2 bacterium RIFCSPHIGHO2_02_FULL_67_20]